MLPKSMVEEAETSQDRTANGGPGRASEAPYAQGPGGHFDMMLEIDGVVLVADYKTSGPPA